MITTDADDTETIAGANRQRESLATMFAGVCERFGTRVAVSLGDESICYDELNLASDRVAAALQDQGVGARESSAPIVAICIERSIEMVIAMLGVVKCGAAYLPIDPMYPPQRIAETIEDAAPVAVITTQGIQPRLEHASVKCLLLNDLQEHGADDPAKVWIGEDDPAYVIYTSGSTGRPKGVLVSHRNVVRLLRETEPWFQFNEHDVWSMFHSFAFDFSVWEMWGALLNGARLVIVPFVVSRSPEDFHTLLRKERVTVLNQTPSAFLLLDEADGWSRGPKLALRVVIFGGEALTLGSLEGWIERHGDASPQLINMYGITETTVHVTYRRIFAGDARRERESLIGEPIPDMQIHLMDEQLQPVADGEEGEICVGGGGVALGYLNRPKLTAERFCSDPFGNGARMYRSGDLARRRADGELVYVGRRDFQVKINGFRIELGEIEATLAQHESIKQACVLVDAVGGYSRLVAYYSLRITVSALTRERATAQSQALNDWMAARLPAHLLPLLYRPVVRFPLNANGKIDRAALLRAIPEPQRFRSHALVNMSAMEDIVTRVWAKVLGAEQTTLDANFFDAGGTSLLLIAVRTGLQERLDRDIPITWMFESTTIRALAKRLTEPSGSQAARTVQLLNNAGLQRNAFARARAARSFGR